MLLFINKLRKSSISLKNLSFLPVRHTELSQVNPTFAHVILIPQVPVLAKKPFWHCLLQTLSCYPPLQWDFLIPPEIDVCPKLQLYWWIGG